MLETLLVRLLREAVYVPPCLTIPPEFQFFPPNHSVVRAEYGYPCVPYELSGQDRVGFFSGFIAISTVLDNVGR